MSSSSTLLYSLLAAVLAAGVAYLFYLAVLEPAWNPLRKLPGPPTRSFFGNHMGMVLE